MVVCLLLLRKMLRPRLCISGLVQGWKIIATWKGLRVEDECLSAKKGVNQFTLLTRRPFQRCFVYLFLRIRDWSSSTHTHTHQALSLVSLYVTFHVTEKIWTDTSVKLCLVDRIKNTAPLIQAFWVFFFFCCFVGRDADFELTCITGCCSAKSEQFSSLKRDESGCRDGEALWGLLDFLFWSKPNFQPFKAKRPPADVSFALVFFFSTHPPKGTCKCLVYIPKRRFSPGGLSRNQTSDISCMLEKKYDFCTLWSTSEHFVHVLECKIFHNV